MNGFGIELEPLSEQTLELVRKWRNDERTSRFMEFREKITSEVQQKWFASIENAHYFIIKSNAIPVGMIDLKKINKVAKTAESGLLIGEPNFVGTGIALGASLLLLDFAFGELTLETVSAKISSKNSEAQKYNQLLGFSFTASINDNFETWELPRQTYLDNRNRLIQLLG